MNERPDTTLFGSGFCLAELLVVLGLLGVCLAVGSLSMIEGVGRQEVRGTAQASQAATAWAQVGVLWHGGRAKVAVGRNDLAVIHDLGRFGGDLGSSGTPVSVYTNVDRWSVNSGVAFSVGGDFAAPDSGGSVYFESGGSLFRVTVRPGSGLTSRSLVAR